MKAKVWTGRGHCVRERGWCEERPWTRRHTQCAHGLPSVRMVCTAYAWPFRCAHGLHSVRMACTAYAWPFQCAHGLHSVRMVCTVCAWPFRCAHGLLAHPRPLNPAALLNRKDNRVDVITHSGVSTLRGCNPTLQKDEYALARTCASHTFTLRSCEPVTKPPSAPGSTAIERTVSVWPVWTATHSVPRHTLTVASAEPDRRYPEDVAARQSTELVWPSCVAQQVRGSVEAFARKVAGVAKLEAVSLKPQTLNPKP
eukprot:356882-Chlamydomonas_euryale.AAC.6